MASPVLGGRAAPRGGSTMGRGLEKASILPRSILSVPLKISLDLVHVDIYHIISYITII
jgi:hypothetical protein